MPQLVTIYLTTLLLLVQASAEDFLFVAPPKIYSGGQATLKLTSEVPIKVAGSLPDDARVRLLAHRSYRPSRGLPLHRLEIEILPLRTGTFELPPVPIFIGGERRLFRCPPLEALENTAPEETSQLINFWNGEPNPPEQLWQGQQVGLDILQVCPVRLGRPAFFDPILDLQGAEFELHVEAGAQHNTPLAPIGRGFLGVGRSHSSRSRSEFKGEKVNVNRSKAFFSVAPDATRVSLQIASTASAGGQPPRTRLMNREVPVVPLPPLTETMGVSSGLIGDWKISGRLEPEEPEVGEPFSVIIDFEGRGDPANFIEPDFSSPQFRSIQTEVGEAKDSKVDYYRGTFTQRLLPLTDSSSFPELSLATFSTTTGVWVDHLVTEGFGETPLNIAKAVPAMRAAVVRPLPMNFPKALLGAFAVAPLLPLLGLFIRRLRERRNSPKRLLDQRIRRLASRLDKLELQDDSVIDVEMLPLLREYLGLPPGASATEVAESLEPAHAELAQRIRSHTSSSFGARNEPFDPRKFAVLLGRLACLFITLWALSPFTATASSTPALAEAERLVAEQPEQPAHQLRLARQLFEDGHAHRARAVCHHLLLLDPFYPEARELMNEIRERIGDPAAPGSRFLELRPDQIAVIAAVTWVIGFLLVTLRVLNRSFPRWPAIAAFSIATIAVGAAFLRHALAYTPGRYMVATQEVMLETEPGRFAPERAPLRSGEIIQPLPAEPGATHFEIRLGEESFFVPAESLYPVW